MVLFQLLQLIVLLVPNSLQMDIVQLLDAQHLVHFQFQQYVQFVQPAIVILLLEHVPHLQLWTVLPVRLVHTAILYLLMHIMEDVFLVYQDFL